MTWPGRSILVAGFKHPVAYMGKVLVDLFLSRLAGQKSLVQFLVFEGLGIG